MEARTLIAQYPRLYHMAEDGSWPNILKYGLLSTSVLLTLYGYTGTERQLLESEWRPEKVTISCEGLEDAVIRDQKPMPPGQLQKCLLNGMTPSEWYYLINGRTYFWVKWNPRVEWFLGGREYRDTVNLIIAMDTRRLLARYASRVTLSGINSGSTYYSQERRTGPEPRGRATFKTIGEYNRSYVAELAVENGIPDMKNVTVSVAQWVSNGTKSRKIKDIWPTQHLF